VARETEAQREVEFFDRFIAEHGRFLVAMAPNV